MGLANGDLLNGSRAVLSNDELVIAVIGILGEVAHALSPSIFQEVGGSAGLPFSVNVFEFPLVMDVSHVLQLWRWGDGVVSHR